MRFAPLTLPLLIALLGCSGVIETLDTTPAKLEIIFPSGPLIDDTPVQLRPRVLTKAGKELPDEVGTLSYSSVPTGIVDVSPGTLRCVASGDASVVVTGRGVSATSTIRCRIVAKIAAPPAVSLLVAEPGTKLDVQPLDANGAVVPDVQVVLEAKDRTIAAVSGTTVEGVSVGRTSIVARAGKAIAEIPVEVSQRIQTDTLALADGATVAYTLERGNYRVEVNVRASDGSGYGVVVRDAGGGCGNSDEKTNHLLNCVVQSTSSIVISNPTTFGFGPPEMGNVAIYRVP